MVSVAGQLCKAPREGCGDLKLARLTHGRVIFAGSTFRR